MKPFKLGMGQMLVEGGEPIANLGRAAIMIRKAAAAGCAIVVLPECLDLGWTHPSARETAHPVPGPHTELLCVAAKASSIYTVAGVTEAEGDKVFNTAVVISPEGKVVAKHRKNNILDIARDLYTPGEGGTVIDTPLGKMGLTICADNFPDSIQLAESLAKQGATLFPSPCAWAVDGDHDNAREPYGELWKGSYSTLTKNHDVTIVGVSNVGRLEAGPWKGRKCIGCSLAMGPGGKMLAQGPYGEAAEELLVIEVS